MPFRDRCLADKLYSATVPSLAHPSPPVTIATVPTPSTAPRQATPASPGAPGEERGERGRRVVDLALRYAALHLDEGLTQREIGRLRRKSRGYVSILVRFGTLLRTFSADERAVLRHPRITFRVAQRLVRTTSDALTIRAQLRAAVSGFSSFARGGRRGRGRRRGGARSAGALVAEAATELPRWVFNPDLAREDPMAMLDAYEAHLAALHRAVGRQVRAAIAIQTPGVPVSLVGQSLRALTAEVQRRASEAAADPIPDRALHLGATTKTGTIAAAATGSGPSDAGPASGAAPPATGLPLEERRRVLARLAALDRLLRSFTDGG